MQERAARVRVMFVRTAARLRRSSAGRGPVQPECGPECPRRSRGIHPFGVSVNDRRPDNALALVRGGAVGTGQVVHHIFDRSPADAPFPACEEYGVGVLARVPPDEGGLADRITGTTSAAIPGKVWVCRRIVTRAS
jgi:hypothetical protein